MNYIVIAIENNLVRLEDRNGNIADFPDDLFDFPLKEGYVLQKVDDRFVFDEKLTHKRKSELHNKLQKLFGKK